MKHLIGCMLLVAGLSGASEAGEPSADAVLKGLNQRRGLIVQVGAVDGALARDLAKAEAVVVAVVAADAATEDRVRATLVAGGVHGQATAMRLTADQRLPLADDSAAGVVADLDAQPAVAREELLRVLRPGGTAWLGQGGQWRAETKPRPAEYGQWPQYHHDAAMSDVGTDRRAGPAYGVQWASGPQTMYGDGVRVIDDVIVTPDGPELSNASSGLIARDAFSGLPLWQRNDVGVRSRYAFLVDRERVYVYPNPVQGRPAPYMIALNLRTGDTVQEFREGISFLLPASMPKDNKAVEAITRPLVDRSKDFQVRLTDDGLLLQVCANELVVLDAKSGQRRWAKTATDGAVWMHPVMADGKVFVIEGRPARSFSYTHWPVATTDKLWCFKQADGSKVWELAWPAGREPAVAYNLAYGAGKIAGALRLPAENKGKIHAWVVDAATGKEEFLGSNKVFQGEIGGGHSSARALAVGDRLWLTTIVSVPGSMSLSKPADDAALDQRYARLSRPVGCTAFRVSGNRLFGSLTTYDLTDTKVQQTDAARTACDVGAFPANGLTYITPNHCFCQPYLPGSMAFHPRKFPGLDAAERLEPGSAKPAAAKLGPGWPMFLADNQRSSWTAAKLPDQLAQAWTTQPAGTAAVPPLLAEAWKRHWYAHGPVTQASLAEGIGVVGLVHRQQVLAFDPATGKELWRVNVDGRVDTAPTIFQGLVLLGTRSGWVYALNRDTGERVWRFFAAPRRERIVVDGQLESPWPVFGSLNVDDRGVYAVAGRHTDTDGGLWWWRLEPATGKVLGQGRIGQDELKDQPFGGQNPGRTIPTGSNTPAVMTADRFLLAGVQCRRTDRGLETSTELFEKGISDGEGEFWRKRHATGVLVPGNQGLLARVGFLGGYKLSAYAFTQGRLYAWNGPDFVMVGGSPHLQHRGGNSDSVLRRLRRLPEVEAATRPNEREPNKPLRVIRGSELIWQVNEDLPRGNGLTALAVAGDRVLVGLEVTNRDQWRERQAMACRVQVLDYADGKVRQNLALPAPPLIGGIAVADGRVVVVTEDGSVTAFAAAP